MNKDYLINYLVKNDGTTFNCYSIVSGLNGIKDYVKDHFKKLQELYDDGENFELVPNSERFFELNLIDVDAELKKLEKEKEEKKSDG